MVLPPADPFPGWRIDPDVPHSERFWDGRQWTDKIRPAPRSGLDRSRAEIVTPDGITIVAEPAVPPAKPAVAHVPIPRPPLTDLPPPAPNTLAEPAVLKPVPVPAPTVEPERVSIFSSSPGAGRANDGDFFTVARRVQLPVSGSGSRAPTRRVTRSRSSVIGAACLAIGLMVGFALGARVAADDPAGGAPTSATE